jgi:hypothetical protein
VSKKNNDGKESGWWFDRYEYDYRDYSYTRESGSRGWMSKLGGYGDYDYSGLYGSYRDNPNQVYQNLLNQLQNSANIIGNDDTGVIKVKWSDGNSTNSPSETTVYLSPDRLTNDDGHIEEETVDAMTGKIYLASALRDTVDETVYATAQVARLRATESHIHRGAVSIWEAIETSIARHKVIEDWGGFAPYICKDSERSSASQDDVQKFLDASVEQPNIDAAVLGISWNLLNPSSRVRIPDCYDSCVAAAANTLGDEIPSEERFRSAYSLASKIASLLPSPVKEEQQEENSEEDEDSDDSCDCEACRKARASKSKKTEDKTKERAPKVLDSSLLGERVENGTDDSLADQSAESDDPSDTDKAVSVDYDRDDEQGKNVDFIPMPPPDDKARFDQMIRKHSSAIRTIRNGLAFRNNSMRMPSFGHRSGDIDENALFKIKMNDDRLMLRTEVVSEKSIAVCLLVDESGSMGGYRVNQAREVAVTLATALNGVSGISTSVYGHTAEEDGTDSGVSIREYFTPRNPNLSSCMRMSGRMENHDGFAIQHTANAFFRDYGTYDRKIMFVISDGQPAGSNYGGSRARKHMRKVADACRSKLGVEVYGIGIDSAYENATGNEMYGQGNFVVLQDVTSSLPIMARFVRQVAMSMKK